MGSDALARVASRGTRQAEAYRMEAVPPIVHRGVAHVDQSSRWGAQIAMYRSVGARCRRASSSPVGKCDAGASSLGSRLRQALATCTASSREKSRCATEMTTTSRILRSPCPPKSAADVRSCCCRRGNQTVASIDADYLPPWLDFDDSFLFGCLNQIVLSSSARDRRAVK